MLTIEVKLNGQLVAEAAIQNTTDLAALSDYRCRWHERGEPDLGISPAGGAFVITGHRRRQTVWALVARAAAAILGQKVERMEGKG